MAYLLLGFGLAVIDQVSKFIAAEKAAIFRNYNFAFSLSVPQSLMWVYYSVILGVMIWYVYAKHRMFNGQEKIAWALTITGALCNIGERLVLGYVRDFIFISTGVFNLADFFILAGVALLLFRPKVAKSI